MPCFADEADVLTDITTELATEVLTEDEIRNKKFTLTIKSREIKLYCKNKYGIWHTDYLKF